MTTKTIKFVIVILILCIFLVAMPASTKTHNFMAIAQSKEMQIVKLGKTDEEAIRKILLGKWRKLWSTGNGKFTFKGYEQLFLTNDSFTSVSTLSPSLTLINNWQTYSDIWEPYMNREPNTWKITQIDVNKISVAGDMAWSSINLYGQDTLDGKELHTSEHCTHIWRKIDGQWSIVYEHVSGPINLNA
ncbi:YybH family protein [Nostoc sphaeroides]|uniref:SnoaL-like domain-containing protein n=1 Tax=Nostoc sphaeroides CCNUC1 TaxID=2653204 RepID=A0A5P8WK35_9NOSO|nr:nuclear transport factor 2 family protein [Nostoc sphaeroides]QFS52516.1 hypothetical protein GXM_10271 [Nostoc sphaeroides CCNUC1]